MKNLTTILTVVRYLKTTVTTPVILMNMTTTATMEMTTEKTRKINLPLLFFKNPCFAKIFIFSKTFFFFIFDSVELFLQLHPRNTSGTTS